jgi:hypothetical protein
LARADKILTGDERDQVCEILARDPECGDVMKGTGGLRKMRFAPEGRGKSGGARIVYFFYNEGSPLFLITLFAKNEKENLSVAERNKLSKWVTELKKQLRKGTKSDA